MKKTCLFTLLIIILVSCKKEEDLTPQVNTFPMTVGSEWIYDVQSTMKYYDTNTVGKYSKTETSNYTIRIWIDKDTIIDNKQVKVFKQQNDGKSDVFSYKYIDKEGLKIIGYDFSNLIFNRVKKYQIKSYSNDVFNAKNVFIKNDIESLELKLPLTKDSKWIVTDHPSDVITIKTTKEVTGVETLNLINKKFNCYKVNSTLYFQGDIDNHLNATGWYSNIGLVKSVSECLDIDFADQNGNSLGHGDSVTTQTLKSYIIE